MAEKLTRKSAAKKAARDQATDASCGKLFMPTDESLLRRCTLARGHDGPHGRVPVVHSKAE